MDKKPQDFCNLLIAMMKELINIITNRYPEGFTWNAQGVELKDYKESTEPAKPAKPAEPVNVAKNIRDELAQMFNNRKSDGHLDLKHVEKDQMSHKNPSLRGNVKMVEKKEKYFYIQCN